MKKYYSAHLEDQKIIVLNNEWTLGCYKSNPNGVHVYHEKCHDGLSQEGTCDGNRTKVTCNKCRAQVPSEILDKVYSLMNW